MPSRLHNSVDSASIKPGNKAQTQVPPAKNVVSPPPPATDGHTWAIDGWRRSERTLISRCARTSASPFFIFFFCRIFTANFFPVWMCSASLTCRQGQRWAREKRGNREREDGDENDGDGNWVAVWRLHTQ